MIAMLAANATTTLNITTLLDAVRVGPTELLQETLTHCGPTFSAITSVGRL
jgi:phthiodiolone/phenolphthiodiolone dimycocerosates ketoreductase